MSSHAFTQVVFLILTIKIIIIVASGFLQIGITYIYAINKVFKRGTELPWALCIPQERRAEWSTVCA